ncbi:MAG: histidine--tRNA ligase [Candidatus Promineifilaceae bacterium]
MSAITRIQGMQDLLPEDWRYWSYVIQTATDTAQNFGFEQISVPVMEKHDLFVRGIGTSADFFVQKEMYTIEESNGSFITLRPEFTAGVVRAYLNNGFANRTQPVKVFMFGPIFRRERPQAGRFRQHSQFDCEIMGEMDPATDVEVMMLAMTTYQKLGYQGLTFQMNSTGCRECRPTYIETLRTYLNDYVDQLAPVDIERLGKNPLRVLDSKEKGMQAILANAPHLADHLCDDCDEHFGQVKSLLTALGQSYSINFRLVRGMDYYEKTVFEVWAQGIGAQAAVCGGGRYNLAPEIGGHSVPCVGFGSGIERIILGMKDAGVEPPPQAYPKVMITHFGGTSKQAAHVLAFQLREAGVGAIVAFARTKRSVKSQMREANKRKVDYVLILGEDEVAAQTVKIRPMGDGDQTSMAQSDVIAWLQARL